MINVSFLIDGKISYGNASSTAVSMFYRQYDGSPEKFAELYLDVKNAHRDLLIKTIGKNLSCAIHDEGVIIDYMSLVRYWET
jgi:hypothetical protein